MKTNVLFLLIISFVVDGKQISLSEENASQNLKSVGYGQEVTVKDVYLGHLGKVTMVLRSQKVFADDAEITINTASGIVKNKPPKNKYFNGYIKDMPGSRVFIGFLENGEVEGVFTSNDENKFTLNWQQDNQFKLVDQNSSLSAQNDQRWISPNDFLNIPEDQILVNKVAATGNSFQGNIAYQLDLAVETDVEFYNKFGNATDSTNYIAGLIGYISSIYTDEIDTTILIGSTSLWTGNINSDPWDATNTECALYELGKYWNDNNAGVDRALTHLISGKSSNSGIAWVGVLCNGGFSTNISQSSCNAGNMSNYDGADSNYGGAYGVSSGLDANFDPNNPQSVWDSVVVSHELGHNFNSPHTHCYENIGGNSNPVDECNNSEAGLPGCYSGSQSLPGPSGQGSGTIMSYCHLLSPGLSNISLTLGTGHNFGVEPIRVPNRMRSHVETAALANPFCIVPLEDDVIFDDGFELNVP